jgi:hypothetical protein
VPATVGAVSFPVSGTGAAAFAASTRSLMLVRSRYRSSCQLPSITMTTEATIVTAAAPSQRGVSRNRYTP